MREGSNIWEKGNSWRIVEKNVTIAQQMKEIYQQVWVWV